jgi:hypothetical protein
MEHAGRQLDLPVQRCRQHGVRLAAQRVGGMGLMASTGIFAVSHAGTSTTSASGSLVRHREGRLKFGARLSPMSIDALPDELLLHVFSYVEAQRTFNVDRVCTLWSRREFSSVMGRLL